VIVVFLALQCFEICEVLSNDKVGTQCAELEVLVSSARSFSSVF
jgi:hypothetical protein